MEDFLQGGGFQLLLFAVFVAIAVFFLLTQQRTLESINYGNRQMKPGHIWFQLIPILGLLWQFMVVMKISDSIQRQLSYVPDDSVLGVSEALIKQTGSRPTYGIGMAYCILISAGTVLNFFLKGAGIGALFTLAGMICWIIYWVQLSRYKRQIAGVI